MRIKKFWLGVCGPALLSCAGIFWGGFAGQAQAQTSDLFVPEVPPAPIPSGLNVEPLTPGIPQLGNQDLATTAVQAIEAKDWAKAEAALRELLELEPTNEDAVLALASVLLQQKKTQAAIQLLQDQVSANRQNKKFQLALGQVLLEANQICNAVRVLERLYCQDSVYPDLRHYLGLAYLRANQPLRAYRMLGGPVSSEAMGAAQKLVKGAALAALGQGAKASARYRSVIAAAPSEDLVKQARDLQRALDESICDPDRVQGYLRISTRYDDNPGVVPTNNEFGGTTFAPEPSGGNAYLAAMSYDLYRGYQGDIDIGAIGFMTDNYEVDEFNLANGQFYVSGVQRDMWRCMPTQKGVRFDYDYLTVGSDSFLQRFSGTSFYSITDTDFTSWTGLVRYSNLDFLGQGDLDNTVLDADSQDYAIGLYRQRQSVCRKLSITGGYQYDYNDSQGQFDFNNSMFTVGTSWTTPWYGIVLTSQYQLYLRSYVQPDPIELIDRDDMEHVIQLAATAPLGDNWYLTFGWLRDRNDSNIARADYTRNLYELTLQYNFGGAQRQTNVADRQRLTY